MHLVRAPLVPTSVVLLHQSCHRGSLSAMAPALNTLPDPGRSDHNEPYGIMLEPLADQAWQEEFTRSPRSVHTSSGMCTADRIQSEGA